METVIDRDNESRLRRLFVSQGFLLHAFSWRQDMDFVVVPVLNIPADIEVVSIHHDFNSRGFMATLRHPSFSPVPDGEMIPELEGTEYGQLEYPRIGLRTKAAEEREAALENEATCLWMNLNILKQHWERRAAQVDKKVISAELAMRDFGNLLEKCMANAAAARGATGAAMVPDETTSATSEESSAPDRPSENPFYSR